MKNFTVEFALSVSCLSVCIHIEAKIVLKIGDQEIIADGVKIRLPGKVVEISS
jgi:hypothetical protein